MAGVQLTLQLQLRDDAKFSNFLPGANQSLLTSLNQLVVGQGESIYLWGSLGVGRSHLLQACCHAASEKDVPVIYLSLADVHIKPKMLEGMEKLVMVCLDDINAVVGDAKWEEALFHFYNKAREGNTRLLIAGDDMPQRLPIKLADLRSRLTALLSFQVAGLNDEQKILALQLRAKNRGLQLPKEVGTYLINRYPRDMAALFSVLEALDQASLVAKRRLTIPFVKLVLK